MSEPKKLPDVRKPEGDQVPALRSVRAPEGAQVAPAASEALSRASSARGRELRPADEAWAVLAAPLTEREGIRVLFIGVTHKGKTTAVKHFLRFIAERNLVDLVLVHDLKKPLPQYEGQVIHDARHVYTSPPETWPAVRVLRRRDLDHLPTVENAARVTIEAGYNDVRTMLVVDELQRGLTDGGKFESPSLRRVYCEGAGLHASVVATKQLPQNIPTEATGQSARVYLGSNREGINYLLDERKIDRQQAEIIESLTVGEFIFFPQEGNCDGLVYKVPPP